MKRWIAWGVGLVVLIGLVLSPALFGTGSGEVVQDAATITDYRADFVVEEDGDLRATETLRVELPPGKHGIFRFFDIQDPHDEGVRLQPRDISVMRDGASEPFTIFREGNGRYRNVRIGSPTVTLFGEHTYVINYRIEGVLAPKGDQAQFYWNVIPGGWRMPIRQSTLTVELPRAPQAVRCAVGAGSRTGCTPDISGNTLRLTTGELLPNTPVTVQANLNMEAPDRGERPWSVRFDPVFGPSVILLLLILGLAAAAAIAGLRTAMSTREPSPAYPLMYGPPEGIGPAQAKYLFTETVGQDEFVASIMQTAEKGATTLSRNGGWTITDTGNAGAWQQLDPVSSYAAQSLGVPGGSFRADSSVEAGKKLKSAISSFESSTRDWARKNGLMVKAGLGSFGALLWFASLALTAVIAFWNPFNLSALALIPGLWTVFSMEIVKPGAGTRRTASGRDLWSRIGGFQRILATSSSEERFDFSGRKELYTAFIPYAVAFGVADQWADKYRTEMGEEPPAPAYFGGAAGYAAGSYAPTMANDFSSTVSSAISAYNATQSSSSSGGGGFSGGGGGGGGGGGSW